MPALQTTNAMAVEVPAPAEDEGEKKFPTGPQGRLETIKQREQREAHNLRMKFNRSFESSLFATVA